LEEERVVGAMLDSKKLVIEGQGRYKYTVTSFKVFQLDINPVVSIAVENKDGILRMSALESTLDGLGIIDEVLPEPSGGNNWAPLDAGNTLKKAIEKHLNALLQMPEEDLIEERYKKFRVLGKFIEANNIEEIYSEITQKTE